MVFVCEGTDEDWYLASGGICQRNSCRVHGSNQGPLGGTIDFAARQWDLFITAPLCQRSLVTESESMIDLVYGCNVGPGRNSSWRCRRRRLFILDCSELRNDIYVIRGSNPAKIRLILSLGAWGIYHCRDVSHICPVAVEGRGIFCGCSI